MTTDLHLETITPGMQEVLTALMDMPALQHFRLVGGTALALQLGHRVSVDLDLFTDQTTDFEELGRSVHAVFPKAILLTRSSNGQTWSIENVKCDLFDWKIPFLNPPHVEGNWRLASMEDIVAYKLEAFADRKSEKDFRDIAEILRRLSFGTVVSAFRRRYPFIQTGAILPLLLKPEIVVRDASIQMLREGSIDTDAILIAESVRTYEAALVKEIQDKAAAKDRHLRTLLEQKKKRD